LHLIDIPATDATGWTLRSMILAEVIPGDLADGAEQPWLARINLAAQKALELDRGLIPPRWVRALLLVQYGKAHEARDDLDVLQASLPNYPEVLFLKSVALSQGSDAQKADALRVFQEAGDLIATRRSEHSGLSGSTAFDDQVYRKLCGAWASLALERNDVSSAKAALERWSAEFPSQGPEAFWQDQVFGGLLEAMLLDAEGHFELAIERLDEVAALHTGLALPLTEKARILSRMGEANLAEDARIQARSRPQSRPADMQEFLRSGYFGLRPFSGSSRFHVPIAPSIEPERR
jgi:hypothetical protein